MRWFPQLTGAQTNKAEGLERLHLTADKGRYLAPFARLLLAVAALRDKDSPDGAHLACRAGYGVPGFPKGSVLFVEGPVATGNRCLVSGASKAVHLSCKSRSQARYWG